MPIVANGPGFTPQLLGSPAGPALKENLTVVSSMAPPALDKPAATQLQAAFVKEYPGAVPTQVGSLFGYVQAKVTKEILQKACDNKDLTRAGCADRPAPALRRWTPAAWSPARWTTPRPASRRRARSTSHRSTRVSRVD